MIGALAKIVTFRHYTNDTGNTSADIAEPHVSGLGDPVLESQLNEKFDQYAAALISRYEADVAEMENGGHEAVYSTWETLVDNDRQLTIAIYTDIAMGDCQEFSELLYRRQTERQAADTGGSVPQRRRLRHAHQREHTRPDEAADGAGRTGGVLHRLLLRLRLV